MSQPSQEFSSTSGEPDPPRSLEDVWVRYGEQLRRRARTRLRQYGLSGQAESMDICNDVMADLIRRNSERASTMAETNKVIGVEDMMGYILRAIDNQVLDTFRTLARQCRDFRRVDNTSVEQMPLGTQTPTPSQIAIHHEVLQRVRSLLGPDDAKAVDMMLENRDWKEIGNTLGVEPDTARMRVRRALDRIRSRVGFSEDDGSSKGGSKPSERS
jgi:RNA polymerase sigma factor (sigma-70 family)